MDTINILIYLNIEEEHASHSIQDFNILRNNY